jgi:hypothetical protein
MFGVFFADHCIEAMHMGLGFNSFLAPPPKKKLTKTNPNEIFVL